MTETALRSAPARDADPAGCGTGAGTPLSGMHLVRGEMVHVRSVNVPTVPGHTTVSVVVEFERSVIGLATFHRARQDAAPGTVRIFVDPAWPQEEVLDLLWRGLLASARTALLPQSRHRAAPATGVGTGAGAGEEGGG